MRCLFALLALLLVAAAGQAQDAPLASPSVADTSRASPDTAFVSMVTVLPGEPSYARFGHTALRLFDPARGLDLLYNYGTFRFDASFLPKFVYGKLDYELSVAEFALALRHYAEVERRGLVEQRLRLTPAQRDSLAAFLDWNARPENATYRYLFLDDNCSTRPRDAVERVLGPSLAWHHARSRAARGTFRQLLRPYQTGAPLMLLGTDLGLGARIDREATPRQAQFLPDVLMHDLDAATASGQPLVTRTDTLVHLPRPAETAFPWTVVAALGLLVAAVAFGRKGGATRLDRVLFGAAGVGGLVLAFLVFVSLHDVTRPNWNLAWLWPTHLLYAFAAGRARWARAYAGAFAAAVALLLLGWTMLPQTLPLEALPLAGALGVRAFRHAWPRRGAAQAVEGA